MSRRIVAMALASAVALAGCDGRSADAPAADDAKGWTALLRRSDVYGQKRAIDALARIGEPAIPGLRGALDDTRVDVRLASVRTLSRLREPAAPALGAALRDVDPVVRNEACDALVAIGPDAADEIRTGIGGSNHSMRESAVLCAGRLGAAGIVILPDAFADGDRRVRGRGVEAALAIGPAALPALEAARSKLSGGDLADVDRAIAEIRSRDVSKPAA
ncbi:MAG: HEAT repeat domain-containing protein [Alphaproteobacteria bacterium]